MSQWRYAAGGRRIALGRWCFLSGCAVLRRRVVPICSVTLGGCGGDYIVCVGCRRWRRSRRSVRTGGIVPGRCCCSFLGFLIIGGCGIFGCSIFGGPYFN